MRFHQVELATASGRLDGQHAFYAQTLGLPVRATPQGFAVAVGETELEFVGAKGEPFYHFALLVPGERFDAALVWATERVTLLPHSDSAEVVFEFPAWNARACYFHDPAGNIVELIAHLDRERTAATGVFAPSELIGLSELGLVGRPPEMAAALTDRLGLSVWDGQVAGPDALAFVGEPARTLILASAGRGWLPTGRPGELHPAQVVLSGGRTGEAGLEDGLYRISARP